MQCSRRKTAAWHSVFFCAIIMLPAVLFGIFAMIADGVSAALWGQQAAAFVVFAPLGLLRRKMQRIPAFAGAAVCLLALSATLLFPAVGGAKRWLDLGVLHVNAGMLVLPAMLVLLGDMKCMHPALMIGAAVLCLQPDFSQLTAFSLGALPMLWQSRKKRWFSAAAAAFPLICLMRCAGIPTALEPVAYCEGILAILGGFSPLMQAAGWLALAMIPGCFLCRFCFGRSVGALCLAIYYAVTMLFSLTGQYPVPFMGFGLSPIAGYWLAYLFIR